jgi:tRNA nucleotidyltransferase/poly(A) polymerase
MSKLQEVVDIMKSCKSVEELYRVDELANEADVELELVVDPEYRRAFDEMEVLLDQEVVEETLPEDVDELKALVRKLRELNLSTESAEAPAKVQKKQRIRAGVSFLVLRKDVEFSQPQAMAIARGIVETGKRELSEREIFELVHELRRTRKLGGGQDPMHIFRYYLAEGTIGYKARRFLEQVG